MTSQDASSRKSGGTKLLDFLDSDRAKRYWGRWKFVRCLVAWTIWFCRYRRPPATLRAKSSHSAKSVRSGSFPSQAAQSDVSRHLEKEVPSTMAIRDRNLSIGTKLYARYRGSTHTAEVI